MLKKWLAISFIIHFVFIFGHITIELKPNKPDETQFTGKPKTKQTLFISLIKPKETQVIKGFKESEGDQSETFSPDDSCPWDNKEQAERWKQYQKEQEELRLEMLREQEEGF